MQTFNGQCACTNIQYSFDDLPINSAFCYCRECQSNSGSDKRFGLWVPVDKFRFTKGTPATFTRIGDSGRDVHQKFCSDCGTTLCAEITAGNFISVSASTVTGNSQFAPAMAIYTASAPDWAVFPEGVPRYDVLPPGMGK